MVAWSIGKPDWLRTWSSWASTQMKRTDQRVLKTNSIMLFQYLPSAIYIWLARFFPGCLRELFLLNRSPPVKEVDKVPWPLQLFFFSLRSMGLHGEIRDWPLSELDAASSYQMWRNDFFQSWEINLQEMFKLKNVLTGFFQETQSGWQLQLLVLATVPVVIFLIVQNSSRSLR